MSSRKQTRRQAANYKTARKKREQNIKSKPSQIKFDANQKKIEQKCIKLFGSKKKSNKFIKQAITKGSKIRTRTKHLRYDYEGYQVLIKNNDLKTNKKLGMKALIKITFDGRKTAQRLTQKKNKNKLNTNDNSSKYPSSYPAQFQYTRNDKILILGEMDFSFALDIAYNIGGNNIVATAYYNKHNQQNAKTKENIKMFGKLDGKKVLFGVDATALELTMDNSLKFDKILFGFPRDSRDPNSQKHNVAFMRKVFGEIGKYLQPNGQFQLLLHINKSGHSPLEQWKLEYPNWKCVHEQIFEQIEVNKMFKLYHPADAQSKKWTPHRTGLYVFKLQMTQKSNNQSSDL